MGRRREQRRERHKKPVSMEQVRRKGLREWLAALLGDPAAREVRKAEQGVERSKERLLEAERNAHDAAQRIWEAEKDLGYAMWCVERAKERAGGR